MPFRFGTPGTYPWTLLCRSDHNPCRAAQADGRERPGAGKSGMNEAPPHTALGGHQSASGSYIAQASGGSTAIVAVFQAALPRAVDPAEVAAAEALLATLPLDALPERRGLPSPHVMPWPPNRFFVGRKGELRLLARRLTEGGTAAVGQSPAVTGMGGQGKTQLAVEFAYRYGRWFRGGVFWLSCADLATMAEAVAACGPALYPTDAGFSARPLPERVALVASAWAGDLPRLLVFDNCEDEAVLDAWVPKGGGCRLLLTARRLSWSPARGIAAAPLGQLARPESLDLLRRHRPDLALNDPGLDAIADEFGDLPLALELAGSYLARYRDEPSGAPAAYLAELRAADVVAHASLTVEDPQAPGRSRSLTGHERDVARTFEMSLRRLQPDHSVDAFARELFARTAWLAPGVPIPRHLLKVCTGTAADDAGAGRRFADALGRLLDLALVERAGDDGAVVLHRLLAAFARSRMEQAGAARRVVETAVADEAGRLLAHNDPTPFRGWATHLVAVALAAKRDGTGTSATLLNTAGYYSMLVENLEASHVMLQGAVEQAAALFGPGHPYVAAALGSLGRVQHQRGELAAGQASLERAVAILERVHGPDRPDVASLLCNLGLVQCDLGKLVTAQTSLERAVAILERVHGPDHPDVARPLGNLGNVQHRRGELAAAQDSLERVLAIRERAYGPDHPQVAVILANLGSVQHRRGDLATGQASLERALAILERVHGPDHSQVAVALANLGSVQHERGDLAAGQASLESALAILEKVHGPDHPDVARTLRKLGSVQYQRGHLAAVQDSLERALAIQEKAYGPDHPQVAATLGDLGSVQHQRGELAAAQTSLERAVAILERVHGPDHLDVARPLGNLGNVQRDLGRILEARESYTRAATIFAAKLGEGHPHTVQSRRLLDELSREAQT